MSRKAGSISVWVKRYTVPICAFQPHQGNVVLPALAEVLLVYDNALWKESALKVIHFLCVVVSQPQNIS